MTRSPRQPGRVYVQDLRAAGQCLSARVRDWCTAQGIDWRAFARDGVAQDDLIRTGDPTALRVVRAAQAREACNE